MREALKLALEALDLMVLPRGFQAQVRCKEAYEAIKEALAQPEQEPVAWPVEEQPDGSVIPVDPSEMTAEQLQRYTTPPQRTWVGLTPQERDEINEQVYGAVPHHVAFHHAIEAKLKEKNT